MTLDKVARYGVDDGEIRAVYNRSEDNDEDSVIRICSNRK